MFNLSSYVNISTLITDRQLQNEKHLNVKVCYLRSAKLDELENMLRAIPSDAENWREKVDDLKSQVAAEKKIRYIIKYDKNYLNSDNVTTLGLFRSVITDGKKVLSFAPPKSLELEEFQTQSDEENRCFLEYCEGTMINMYFDTDIGEWEIATRSNIGARCKFYHESSQTFRRMFLDAFSKYKLEFSDFDTKYCYSFVLQHPENRIVVPFLESKLILTNTYLCEGSAITEIICDDNKCLHRPPTLNLSQELNDISQIVDRISSGKDLEYTLPGAVICDYKKGIRMKIRNPCYEYVRRLKGNNPKLQFQYYHLRKNGKVSEYLSFYPEDASKFSSFRNQLHNWTQQLLNNYISCYICKKAPLRDFPFEFRSHMFTLHRQYLDSLKESHKKITKSVVIGYVNNLPSEHLMASINYPLKKLSERAIKEKLCASTV